MHVHDIYVDAEKGVSVHTRTSYDEMVAVSEDKADFREGDEVQHVGPGYIVFIPRNTIHGRVRAMTHKWTAFST